MAPHRYVAAEAPLVCADEREPADPRSCYDRTVVRIVALAFAAAAVTACIARDRLVCEDDAQCSRKPEGVCHDGACAYPDGECASGLRYGDFAGERAGRCVEDAVADDTSSSGVDPTSDTSGSESGPTSGSSGTDDDTGTIPSVCDGVDCSGAGTCVVLDDAPSCACESGYYTVGLECLLDPCDTVVCHHVDASLGDDANEGTLDAPWQTLGRVAMAFADAQPGEHFLFRRGEVWGDAEGGYRLYITGAAGSSEAPIVVGAYGPLADGRPRIAPGNARILDSSHLVLRDLDIEDDPEGLFDLYGNRPCILVQDSDHVVVLDTVASNCDSRGIWVSYGSSYTAIVGNAVHDSGGAGISITDITYVDPDVLVGHHHWVIDNVVERTEDDGIVVDVGSPEIALGDAKIVRNVVTDSGTDGVAARTTGFTWVVDNTVARAAGIQDWQASIALGAQGGAQLSGNIVLETGSNGILVNHIARMQANTVIHDGDVGEALFVDDSAVLSASHNLLWPRGTGDVVRVIEGAANDHIVELDDSWYGGVDEAACVLRDPLGVYDLPAWRAATGFDLASACGPIPGLGAFVLGLPAAQWDDVFWAAFAPDASWSACADPRGARDCDGAAIGPRIEPLTDFDEAGGLGWSGPIVVRQRYDIVP